MPYIPEKGDLVWLEFDPQKGREQASTRPALVLSPAAYNHLTNLALFCPITSRIKGYPFEVALPPRLKTKGVVLADQVKSLDWKARKASKIERVPKSTLVAVMERVQALLEG